MDPSFRDAAKGTPEGLFRFNFSRHCLDSYVTLWVLVSDVFFLFLPLSYVISIYVKDILLWHIIMFAHLYFFLLAKRIILITDILHYVGLLLAINIYEAALIEIEGITVPL